MLERESKVDVDKQWESFASLIGNLPLESCSREQNAVTKQWGWKAPENKAFRISGHFTVFSDADPTSMDMCMPLASADSLKEEHRNIYEEYLADFEGNEDEALRELTSDLDWGLGYVPPKTFSGKWLVTCPDLSRNFADKREGRTQIPGISVKDNIKTWVEREYLQIINDINSNSSDMTGVMFPSQVLATHWEQDYAEAVLGKCKIEIIDRAETGGELFVPEKKDDRNLYLPEGTKEKGTWSKYEFVIKTKRRTNNVEKSQGENFGQNKGLIFVRTSLDSDLLAVIRDREIILPEEGKKRTEDIPF